MVTTNRRWNRRIRWNLYETPATTQNRRQTVGFHTQAHSRVARWGGWLLFSAAAVAKIFWWYPTNIVSRMASKITKNKANKPQREERKTERNADDVDAAAGAIEWLLVVVRCRLSEILTGHVTMWLAAASWIGKNHTRRNSPWIR